MTSRTSGMDETCDSAIYKTKDNLVSIDQVIILAVLVQDCCVFPVL